MGVAVADFVIAGVYSQGMEQWLDDSVWERATDRDLAPGVFWITDGEGMPLGIGLVPIEEEDID